MTASSFLKEKNFVGNRKIHITMYQNVGVPFGHFEFHLLWIKVFFAPSPNKIYIFLASDKLRLTNILTGDWTMSIERAKNVTDSS
jgi:hypothetical protein